MPVGTLRTDSEGAFTSEDFRLWCTDHGVKIQFTTRDSPQDNGRAERYGRTLVEMARCLLADSNLPRRFWKNAVETFCYIKNRSYHKSIGTTPYSIWFNGAKPDLSNLKIFGSLGHKKRAKNELLKLNSRVNSVIFLVYHPDDPRLYYIYDRVRERFTFAKDVTLDENRFLSPSGTTHL